MTTATLPVYTKKDFQTIEFTVDLPANAERTITYTVRYTW